MANRVSLSLRAGVSLAAGLQPLEVKPQVQADVLAYLAGRMEQILVEAGTPAEAGAASN